MVTTISKWSRIKDSCRTTPKIESLVVYAMPDIPSNTLSHFPCTVEIWFLCPAELLLNTNSTQQFSTHAQIVTQHHTVSLTYLNPVFTSVLLRHNWTELWFNAICSSVQLCHLVRTLEQWFSTGVPQNPRVPRASAKGSAAAWSVKKINLACKFTSDQATAPNT